MKKFLATAAVIASSITLSACATDGMSQKDETQTQAPYADERTVGTERRVERRQVRSAEPVFERRQVK